MSGCWLNASCPSTQSLSHCRYVCIIHLLLVVCVVKHNNNNNNNKIIKSGDVMTVVSLLNSGADVQTKDKVYSF